MQYLRIFLLIILCQIPIYFTYAQNCSINAGIDASFCEGLDLELLGNLSSLNTQLASLQWSVVSQPSGANPYIISTNSPNTKVTGVLPVGIYQFELTVQCTDSNWPKDTVEVTVIDGPNTASLSSSLNMGCYDGSGISLNGNFPTSGATVNWSLSGGVYGTFSSTNTRATTFFPVPDKYSCNAELNGSTSNLRYTISKNGCNSSDIIPVNFSYTAEPFFAASSNEQACGLCSELFGTCTLDGLGLWTYTGPGTASFASGASNPNTSVCVDLAGTYTFTWTVNGGCQPGTESVTVNFGGYSGSPLQPDAGEGGSFCTFPNSFALNAAPIPLDQIGEWIQIAGAPTIITDSSLNSTTVSGVVSGGGPYKYVWQVKPQGDTYCSSADTITFAEKTEWVWEDIIDDGCGNYSRNRYLATTQSYLWAAFDSISITVLIHQAPGIFADSAIFYWYYFENNGGSTSIDIDGADDEVGTPKDTLAVGVPYTYKISKADLKSQLSSSLYTDEAFYLRMYLIGSANDFPLGFYDYELNINDGCNNYPFQREVYISTNNGFSTANAGTDQVLGCGINSTSLVGTGLYISSVNKHRGIWTMMEGPGTSPLTSISAQETNPIISGLSEGTYRFRYSSEFGNECEPIFDDVRVVISYNTPNISSLNIVNPGFCGTGPVKIASTFDLNVHPDSVSWRIVSPAQTAESLSQAGITGTDTLTLWNLSPSTSYTIELAVANACGSTIQTINFSTGASAGPEQAQLVGSNSICSQNGDVPIAAVPVSVGTGNWSIVSAPSNSIAFITDPNSASTTLEDITNTMGLWVLKWKTENNGCSDSTFLYINRGTVIAPEAGEDRAYCGVSLPYANQLFGEKFSSVAQGNAQGEWTFISGPAVPTISNPYNDTTGVIFPDYGTYLFKFTNSFASCDSDFDVVEITIGDAAPVAYAGLDQDRCGGSNQFSLDALDLGVGQSGAWSVSSASGNIDANFTDINDPNTNVELSGAGEITLAWSSFAATDGCPANTDEISLDYTAPPYAGEDQSLCEASSIILSGNALSGLSGATTTWSLISGPNSPTIDAPTHAVSFVSGLSIGTYEFQYQLIDGACSLSDNVFIEIEAAPNASVGDDLIFCEGQSLNLNGNNAGGSTSSIWSIVLGTNSGNFGNSSLANTNYGSMNDSLYLFRYTITDGACTSYDELLAQRLRPQIIELDLTDASCGNTDGSIDLSLGNLDSSPISYTWSTGASTEDINGLAAGSYSLTLTHSAGCSVDTSVSIINADGPLLSLNSVDGLCPGVTTTLAPAVSGGLAPYTFTWESGAITPTLDVAPNTTTIYSLSLTDDNGCSNVDSLTANVVSVATLSLGADINGCETGPYILSPSLNLEEYTSFYTEDFETDLGIWSQGLNATDDDMDWTRYTGSTGSSNTGPSSAAEASAWYLYTEASSNSNKSAWLTSGAIDLSTRSNSRIRFSYHMYGGSMGSLSLESSIDSINWTEIWNESGNQGDQWSQAAIDLQAYDGESTVYFRFIGLTGNSFTSDMAIDQIVLEENANTYLWNTAQSTQTISVNPTNSTDYYLDIVDKNGCLIVDTVRVIKDCFELGNKVWYDDNTNGIQDGLESGMNGVMVRLYTDNDLNNIPDSTAVDSLLSAYNLGEDGHYLFSNIPMGNYIVEFEPAANYQFSNKSASAGTLSTDSDADISTGYAIVNLTSDRQDVDAGLYDPSLPIVLRDFWAEAGDENVKLNWVTNQEVNAEFFSVERSIDGQIFSPIGRVNALGNTSQATHYDFDDQNLGFLRTMNLYYRLKEQSLDGEISYSSVIEVSPSTSEFDLILNSFPNPFMDQIEIHYRSLEAKSLRLSISNSLGQQLLNQILPQAQGNLIIKTSDWPEGYYFFRLANENQSYTLKVQKQ